MTRSPVLVAACAALLCPAAAAADASPGHEAVVTGTVVDEAGTPVAGAIVEAPGGTRDRTTTTDAEGRFRLPLGHPARGDFWAELHVTETAGGGRLSYVLESGDGPPRPVRVVLKPAKELRVRVSNGRGEPVAGADVWFLSRVTPFAAGRTGADGVWAGRVPADTNSWAVVARKGGSGFDYASADRWRARAEPQPVPDSVTLTLDGARTVRVRTVDRRGEPLEGVPVGPGGIAFEDRPDSVTLSYIPELQPPTGADGVAELDWIPTRFRHSITFQARSEGELYAYDDVQVRPGDGVEQVEIRLMPHERLAGRVTHADGRPAEGVTVEAQGQGAGHNGGRGSARTDADGRYEMNLPAEQAYVVTVRDETWAAAYLADVVLRAGRPAEGADFSLVPATRLHGRVTVGEKDEPAPDSQVTAVVDAGPIPPEIEALRRPGDRVYYALSLYFQTRTGPDGRYELRLGPGDYTLSGPARVEPESLTIPAEDPPAEVVRDFRMPRPRRGPFTVTVVDRAGKPVAGAEVAGVYRASAADHFWYRPIRTDAGGRLSVERFLDPVVLHAKTKDRGLAGVARSDAEEREARVVVGPTASAAGRLLDKAGAAVAERELAYGVRVYVGPDESGPFTYAFGGTTTTDADGRFALDGLVVGETYQLNVRLDEHSSRTVTAITAAEPGRIDLRDLKVDPNPTPPYVPPTPEKRLADALAAKADLPPAERLEQLTAEAHREYTRPLLLFARPGDPAAVELYRLFYEDPEETESGEEAAEKPKSPRELRWEFELAALNLERPGVPEFGAWAGVRGGGDAPPVLATTDFGGRLSATFPLTPGADRKLDRDALAAFLESQRPPTRDAERMLAEALARAKAEDKRVFLIASTSWCGPCRLLARAVAPHKAELERHFVFVKLDVSRDEHGDAVRDRHQRDRDGGVPWYAILDADGKELATSNLPDSAPEAAGENIGFPNEPAGIEHFLDMLRTAPRLGDDALAAIRDGLSKR